VLRWIQGKPIPKAANWAVGAGVLASLGQYEYCQFQRYQERAKVRRVVEVYAAQQARERKERAAAEEEERRRREESAREEEERRRGRGWWRFW
jgi:cytochrome c oxidase assembly protein subunit 20